MPHLTAPLIGAFESTYLPRHGTDVSEATGHVTAWREDLDRMLAAGVRTLRYAAPWHRIERRAGTYDWDHLDAVLDHLAEQGVHVILDVLHHTSYPDWLDDGFRDRRFQPAFVRFAEALARRYPWLPSYTLVNEPFATLFLAGHEALWPPYDSGVEGFARLLRSVLPALSEASLCWAELLPQARHVWIDTCEHHAGTPGGPAEHAALANDRRHIVLDLALHHDLDEGRPFLRRLLEAGCSPLLDLPPVRVDVVGLDYYCHSEWFYDEVGGHAPSPRPVGFAALAGHYAARYGRPVLLAETNIRGLPTDRASWLRYMLEEYERAVAEGVPLEGFCWFPQIDSCDWDSLLARSAGRPDPVGVESLAADGTRRRTVFTDVWEAVARGSSAAELPAFRFQPPCDRQLAGFVAGLRHWPWQEPPMGERVDPIELSATGSLGQGSAAQAGRQPALLGVGAGSNHLTVEERGPLRDGYGAHRRAGAHDEEDEAMTKERGSEPQPDLVVLSHLRWTWVWQRPQHIVSRLAAHRAATGARTWFIEEPDFVEEPEAARRGGRNAPGRVVPRLVTEERDGITRVWLTTRRTDETSGSSGFDARGSEGYSGLLTELFAREGRPPSPDVWLYTPMALDLAAALQPGRLVYDVMDDLAAFRSAPEGLRLRQRRALAEADLVFTGGRSLHQSVSLHRRGGTHLFPSGVDRAHYDRARQLRRPHPKPVAGYVGVIDERMDLQLVADLAAALPDWTIRLVGPVAKIDPAAVPQAENIDRVGMTSYAQLPDVMAGFDVALMPFALNESTRSISPTKTLEYLAAGLPVVSTRVADVVADYSGIVELADDGVSFARACRAAVGSPQGQRERRAQRMLARQEWDVIVNSMRILLEEVTPAGRARGNRSAEASA